MKILISNDSPFAHSFERVGLGRAFGYSGYQVCLWDIHSKSAFDIFNEFQPDIFIGQAYNLTRSLIKCLLLRPNLRVCLKAGDWGPFYNNWSEQDHAKYPILMASAEEKENVLLLHSKGQLDFLFIHYHPDYIANTHGHWIKEGIKVISLMNAADVFDYTNGQYKDELACDIGFVGGRWGYKARTLDRYILPLCNPESKYSIKIFGNQPWNVPQYCGNLPTQLVKHLFSSATICPSISEPHSQDFGFDIIERPFKLLSNKAFVISDYVDGLRKLYNEDELVMVKSPEEFQQKINYFINNPSERHKYIKNGYEKTIARGTYFDRAASVLHTLGLPLDKLQIGKEKVIKELKL